MKTKNKPAAALYCVALAGCLAVFTMCRKDETTPVTAQRILYHETYFNDSLSSKGQYTYTGNLLSDITTYNKSMIEMSRTTFGYSGDLLASYTDFTWDGDSWEKRSLTEIAGYAGGNPAEIIYHNYDWTGFETGTFREVYTYRNNLPDKVTGYSKEAGGWSCTGETKFIYDSRGRILQQCDSGNASGYITDYVYNGDLVGETISKEFTGSSWEFTYKSTMAYSGSLLTATDTYVWDSAAWIPIYNQQYGYNDQGHISNMNGTLAGLNFRITYHYENGTGNYQQVQRTMYIHQFLPGMPQPFPVKAAVQNPNTLFSMSVAR